MKSEKAKEFINHITPNKANFTYCAEKGGLNGSIYADVCKAIEIAEQEAEERIREKAIGAFCENECSGTCKKAAECETLGKFIQKLNEE